MSAIAGRVLAKHDFDRVVMSGYSRLQSSFHVSSFRNGVSGEEQSCTQNGGVFWAHNLNWRKFTALECSLLAFSLGGAGRDWFTDYQALCDGVNGFLGTVSVVSRHMPNGLALMHC